MKFSVLLPTRNRLELLTYAVESVLCQNYEQWEIIISDNHSDQNIEGYVRSLNEPRIRYYRTASFVPVTDNWNNALDKSSGDYVIMLGDDDCLMKGYFTTIQRLAEQYSNPDFIYTSAFLYAYPGVMPGFSKGFLQPYGYARFLKNARETFWLSSDEAHDLVNESANFRVVFGYNMQFSVISRPFIDRMLDKGPFFQSPYPDYYAMNAMLLQGQRILVCPTPLVTIGISPKSFGYYYFNDAEQDGVNFLKNIPDRDMAERLKNRVFPGSNMNTSWLFAMESLKKNFEGETSVHVNYSKYRFLQMLYFFEKNVRNRKLSKPVIFSVWGFMTPAEKLSGGLFLCLASLLPRFIRKRILKLLRSFLRTHPHYEPKHLPGHYASMREVFRQIDPETHVPASRPPDVSSVSTEP